MGSARYIGRIGGLAVALGVGAAVFTGHGVAWAQTDSSDSPDSNSSDSAGTDAEAAAPSAPGPSAGTPTSTGSGSTAGSGPVSTVDAQTNTGTSSGAGSTATETESESETTGEATEVDVKPHGTSGSKRSTATPVKASDNAVPTGTVAADKVVVTTPSTTGPLSNPTAEVPSTVAVSTLSSVSSAKSASDAPSALVTEQAETPSVETSSLTVLAHLTDVLNPFAGDAPAIPVDPPAALILLAAARREIGSDSDVIAPASFASASFAPASLVLTSPITVNPTLTFDDGLIFGNANAVSANGLPLTYTVQSNPSEGGKITLAPEGSAPGTFAYLPYKTVLTSGTEEFSLLVNETTVFESLLDAIPLASSFVQPIGMLLQQVPGLSPFLVPFFGESTVVEFSADPSVLNPAGLPAAYTIKLPSVDGALISVNFFPMSGLQPGVGNGANTILQGPGLGDPGLTDPLSTNGIPSVPGLVPGIASLRPYFNVVTWDPRGEFNSTGTLELDSPLYEAKDVTNIIDFVLAQPETDSHQRIGMVGGSYGGGIQLVSAVNDPRISAIVPGIAWNTLPSSLYPKNVFKTGWGALLALDLLEAGATINPNIYPGVLTGSLFGFLTPDQFGTLAASGTGLDAQNIHIPTLLIQGTVDGLFPLREAVTNAALIDPAYPVKMIWFCGGHGACLNQTPTMAATQNALILNNTLAWLQQYVNEDPANPANDIPTFQWVDQTGTFYGSNLMPFDPNFQGTPISASGPGGILPIVPIIGGSGPNFLWSRCKTRRACRLTKPSSCRLPLPPRLLNALNVAVPVPDRHPDRRGTAGDVHLFRHRNRQDHLRPARGRQDGPGARQSRDAHPGDPGAGRGATP